MCPLFEKQVVDNGIILIKFWLEVGEKEQARRFASRRRPAAAVEASPMDVESWTRWYDYSAARTRMSRPPTPTTRLAHRALGRQEAGAAELHLAPAAPDPLQEGQAGEVKLPKRSSRGRYDDRASLGPARKGVPEAF